MIIHFYFESSCCSIYSLLTYQTCITALLLQTRRFSTSHKLHRGTKKIKKGTVLIVFQVFSLKFKNKTWQSESGVLTTRGPQCSGVVSQATHNTATDYFSLQEVFYSHNIVTVFTITKWYKYTIQTEKKKKNVYTGNTDCGCTSKAPLMARPPLEM